MTPRSELIFDHVMEVPLEDGERFDKAIGTPVVGAAENLSPDGSLVRLWTAHVEWRGDGDCILLVDRVMARVALTDDGKPIEVGHRILVAWA